LSELDFIGITYPLFESNKKHIRKTMAIERKFSINFVPELEKYRF
jgi:hypothetical protein